MEIIVILLILAIGGCCTLGYIVWNLLHKNEKQEEIIEFQQTYLNELNRIITISDEKLKEIDRKGTFKSDDEIGWFFKNILYIQSLLNDFMNYEKENTKENTKEKTNQTPQFQTIKEKITQAQQKGQTYVEISQDDIGFNYPNPGTSEINSTGTNPGSRIRTY